MRALKIMDGVAVVFFFVDDLFCRLTRKLDLIIPEMPEENSLAAQHDDLTLYISRKMGVTSEREIEDIGNELKGIAYLLSPVSAEFARTGCEGGEVDDSRQSHESRRDAAPSDFAPMI